ncbi:hypothetical protein GCM10010211_34070 [Streptomyces albospinus]|uniref:Transposase n=1 Tax=Streptomyces albospinus TaxID=285515 RepID=A0ABQ2V4U8_9ACTN|nr:hypothetical protein [Streptomyces albospinus]GGU66030.1 hypothetical protein GCM10010211_34070 [Streptomyces albospinus]
MRGRAPIVVHQLSAVRRRRPARHCAGRPRLLGPGHDEQAADTTYDDEAAGPMVISPHARRLPPDLRTALPEMGKYDRLLKPATSQATTKGTSA